MHPLLKALNDEFDDSCSVDSDAETIVPITPDSTPVLVKASITAPTVFAPIFTPNATNSIHVDTFTPVFRKNSTSAPAPATTPNATNWKKTMTAKYDESVQEQEKSCQMQTSVSCDVEKTVVPLAPDSTPANIPDTRIPISLDTCTPVLGISSTSTPSASTELAPFDCDQCSSVFQDKMQLKAHLKKVHLNEKPYQCSECRRQFSLMIELQNHVNKFHQDLLLQGIS